MEKAVGEIPAAFFLSDRKRALIQPIAAPEEAAGRRKRSSDYQPQERFWMNSAKLSCSPAPLGLCIGIVQTSLQPQCHHQLSEYHGIIPAACRICPVQSSIISGLFFVRAEVRRRMRRRPNDIHTGRYRALRVLVAMKGWVA